jgi:hypothetical protein
MLDLILSKEGLWVALGGLILIAISRILSFFDGRARDRSDAQIEGLKKGLNEKKGAADEQAKQNLSNLDDYRKLRDDYYNKRR